MAKKIVYYSLTGNTEMMANIIKEELDSLGEENELVNVAATPISAADLEGESILILGCPAMGDEVLEEGTVQPLVDELSVNLKGKKVLLFGSYGWGDGEWMRKWVSDFTEKGAEVVGGGIIANYAPEGEVVDQLKEAVKALVA